jgi:hypothetical protein
MPTSASTNQLTYANNGSLTASKRPYLVLNITLPISQSTGKTSYPTALKTSSKTTCCVYKVHTPPQPTKSVRAYRSEALAQEKKNFSVGKTPVYKPSLLTSSTKLKAAQRARSSQTCSPHPMQRLRILYPADEDSFASPALTYQSCNKQITQFRHMSIRTIRCCSRGSIRVLGIGASPTRDCGD